MPGTGLKLALAVIGGYLLGRTKKMKLAIMLGGALAGKKISTDPTALLGMVSKLVQSSPELQKLDSAVRGRLLEAGKDAALAVASSRMESLTDNLVNRVENLGKPATEAAGAAGQAVGETAGALLGRGQKWWESPVLLGAGSIALATILTIIFF